MLFLFLAETCIIACNCPEASSFRYRNGKLSVLNLDNAGVQPALSSSGRVGRNAYGIRINVERSLIAAAQKNWQIGNSAYANSRECLMGEYHPDITIDNVRIITLNDFDASHSAGAELNSYFKKVEDGKFYAIATLYEKESQVFEANFLAPLEADILLTKAPEHTGMHSFLVEVSLSDGIILRDTTSVQLY